MVTWCVDYGVNDQKSHADTALGKFVFGSFFCEWIKSGNLLVTGPYKVNGVPLRIVNPAYVIATSTKVDLAGVNVANVDDKFFKSHNKYRPSELKNAS